MPRTVEIPDELADPSVIRSRGRWAERFPGTSPAQRARHAQDSLDDTAQLQDERDMAVMERVKTDRNAQNAYFREKDFELRQRNMEDQLRHRETLMQSTLSLREEQAKAARARQEATIAATALKTKTDRLAAEDTTGFSQHMNEILDRTQPGTDDFKIGILRGIESFPHADRNIVSVFSSKAVEGDEDLSATLANIPPGFKASQLRRGVDGKWGFVAKPEGETAAQMSGVDLSRERTFWQKERDTYAKIAASGTEEEKKAAQLRVNHAQMRLDAVMTPAGAAAPTASAATPAQTPTNQPDVTQDEYAKLPSGSTFWFRGKQLTKK